MARQRKFFIEFQTDNGTFYQIQVFNNDAADSTFYIPAVGS